MKGKKKLKMLEQSTFTFFLQTKQVMNIKIRLPHSRKVHLVTVPSETIHTPRHFPHSVVLHPEIKMDKIVIL